EIGLELARVLLHDSVEQALGALEVAIEHRHQRPAHGAPGVVRGVLPAAPAPPARHGGQRPREGSRAAGGGVAGGAVAAEPRAPRSLGDASGRLRSSWSSPSSPWATLRQRRASSDRRAIW